MTWLVLLALLCSDAERRYLVVLESSLQKTGYEQAANQLGAFHHGTVKTWDADDWAQLEDLLQFYKPAYLALVLQPKTIDANLPRRLVPMLTRLDDDPFDDVAFGIITGATDAEAKQFVSNIVRAAKSDLPPKQFAATSVRVKQCMYLGWRHDDGPIERKTDTCSLWVTGDDKDWRKFLERHRQEAQGCGLIEWGHCGDSQGIWLFDMARNRDQDKHWPYEPSKVGNDPRGEMPRMTAATLLAGVNLYPAVIVNGACHEGVTRTTFVEGDLVSTFGDTGGVVRYHPIAAEESFALMAIRHGATAYIAPLAANHAGRASLDLWRILAGGVPLGEVVKRGHDELVMGGAERVLHYEVIAEGKAPPRESPMWADTVHRVLFGDPAFVAWRDAVPTSHHMTAREREDAVEVELTWDRLQSDPWVWDPWRESNQHEEKGRVYETIALKRKTPAVATAQVVRAEAVFKDGPRPLTLDAPIALIERDLDQRLVLHLKVNGARGQMDALGTTGGPKSLHVVVRVTLTPVAPPATTGG